MMNLNIKQESFRSKKNSYVLNYNQEKYKQQKTQVYCFKFLSHCTYILSYIHWIKKNIYYIEEMKANDSKSK